MNYEEQQEIIYKIKEKIEAIFLRQFNDELVDGEHLTLTEAPRFLVFGSQIYLDIRCRERRDDDAWSEYVKTTCQENGLKLESLEWQDWCYFHTYVLA